LAETQAAFRYRLSNFSGPVRSQWARLAVDQVRNEIYALNQRANDIRIFDEHGMASSSSETATPPQRTSPSEATATCSS
jgi:hypothetical protein